MQMSEAQSAITNALRDYIQKSLADEQASEAHLCGTGATSKLEDQLKRHYGMRHAVCVSSATSGLLAVALALGLRRSEFICSPYTYGATLAGWLMIGNKPVFADLTPTTLALDPKATERAISSRTKAVLAVDLFGIPSDTSALRKLADAHQLWYIADAAQSLGAYRNGLPASGLADALIVSFTAGKPVFAGEGGAVLTNHTDLYHKLVWYSQHPHRQRRELGFQLTNEFALNARIHPLAAEWASLTFASSLALLRNKQRRCFELIDLLNQTGLVEAIPFEQQAIVPSFFRLSAAWKGAAKDDRLRAQLVEAGLSVTLAPPPVTLIYRQAAFLAQYRNQFCIPTPCVNAEDQAARRFCVIAERGDIAQEQHAGAMLEDHERSLLPLQ